MYRWFKGPLVLSILMLGSSAWAQEGEAAPAAEETSAAEESESAPAEAEETESAPDGAAPALQPNIQAEELDENKVDAEQAAIDFNKNLLTMEEEVNTLKERVFRSKATLQLLKEIVVQGSSSGSRASIWHINGLGKSYAVEAVSYYLDGQSIYAKSDPSGALGEDPEFKVWEGAIPPGNHNLTINVTLRGNGFGIFDYVEGYTFRLQSTYAFLAEDGNMSNVRVKLDEQGGVARSFEERPNVIYDFKSVDLFETSE